MVATEGTQHKPMNTQPDTTTLAGKIAVMQAAAEGKRIEFSHPVHNNEWRIITEPSWQWGVANYRVHPDDLNPKALRPWRPEEVPLGAQFRIYGAHGYRSIALAVRPSEHGVRFYDVVVTTELLLSDHQHSLDGGRTWLPCGVLDEG